MASHIFRRGRRLQQFLKFASRNIKRIRTLARSLQKMLPKWFLQAEEAKSVAAAVFYAAFSIVMNIMNKTIMSTYAFNVPFTLMLMQILSTLFILIIGKKLKYLNFPDFDPDKSVDFFFPSLGFCLHSSLSLLALEGMNLPMYGAIKRCTPLITLFLSVAILKKPYPSFAMITSITMITVGCLVAGYGDLEFDRKAYIMGSLSVIARGVYLIFLQKNSEMKISVSEMLYMNCCNSVGFFFFMALLMDEPTIIYNSRMMFKDYNFIAIFVAVIASGSILTLSQFICSTYCSALTTSVTGVGKFVIQTAIGFLIFKGIIITTLNIIGVSINTAGGIIYAYLKHKESTKVSPLLPTSQPNKV